jgi:hypothetical protein
MFVKELSESAPRAQEMLLMAGTSDEEYGTDNPRFPSMPICFGGRIEAAS